MLAYQRIGLTVKSRLESKDEAVEKVIQIAQSLGATVYLDIQSKELLECGNDHELFEKAEDVDLILVVGGDGTILRSVRQFGVYDVPLLSVNRGTIGFLAETELKEVDDVLPELLQGGGVIEERSVLHVRAFRGDDEFFSGFALNEAVIAQGAIARLIELSTTVNKEEVATFRADGLIISTPTGSTAYSLAAGGPIVYPTLPATILTPINPYSFSQKPIVIPSDDDVDVTVSVKGSRAENLEVDLTIDGQEYTPLQSGDVVCVCGCEHTVQFVRRPDDTFFRTLRGKLKWAEQIEG